MALEHLDTWWTPPYAHRHWANFQGKIPPFWQEAVKGNITAAPFNQQAAKLLRRGLIAGGAPRPTTTTRVRA